MTSAIVFFIEKHRRQEEFPSREGGRTFVRSVDARKPGNSFVE